MTNSDDELIARVRWPDRRSARVRANQAITEDERLKDGIASTVTVSAEWLRSLIDATYESDQALDTLARRLEELNYGLGTIAEESAEWLRNSPHSPHAAQCARIARSLLHPEPQET